MFAHVVRWLSIFCGVVICIAVTASTAYSNQTNEEDHPSVTRPAALLPLYVAYGSLQLLDVDSTLRGLRAGGREANPIVAPVLGLSPMMVVAAKAGSTTVVVLLTERLRKHHPRAALWTMVALDSMYLSVVARNYGVAARERDRR